MTLPDPFADDVLERLRRSNQDYQHTHGNYIVPLSERLLASRARVRELESALAWLLDSTDVTHVTPGINPDGSVSTQSMARTLARAALARSPGVCEEER